MREVKKYLKACYNHRISEYSFRVEMKFAPSDRNALYVSYFFDEWVRYYEQKTFLQFEQPPLIDMYLPFQMLYMQPIKERIALTYQDVQDVELMPAIAAAIILSKTHEFYEVELTINLFMNA